MKHFYNPKSKTPCKPLMSLVFIVTLVMVSFSSFGQVLSSSNQNSSRNNQVPSEDLNLTNARSINIPESKYNDLQQTLSGKANVAFNCADGLGYILTNVSSPNGNVTGLYSFDLSTNSLTLIKDPLISETTTSQFVNGIGYNTVDNYLYGLLLGSNKVVKIDNNGDVELLTVTGLVGNNYPSGDIDENGILYLYGQGRFVTIDLNPTSPDYLVANIVLQYSTSINDMAFSPVDNNIYILTSTGSRSLLKFDTTTNTISTLGQVSGLESENTNAFGTAYMDALGNMYVANNASGNTYKIATPHQGGLTATFYSNLQGVNPGDGARCPSQPTKPMAIADDICMTSDMTEVTINVTSNDSEGTYPIDFNSVQLIDPDTSLPSNSVTISGQGTFTLATNGEVTFEALPSFTGTSIEYTITDNVGYISSPGVITISLNDTEAPTGSATQEFCENDNPTVADLNASGNTVTWYANANDNNPLNSDDAINEGATYYASQTSNAGCESLERLAVTVNFSPEITLTEPEETSCVTQNGTLYTIEATFTGTAPFTASGDGQSGTFTENNDGTTTWVSSEIESTIETYNVTISDNCGSLDLTGSSPAECLNTPFDCEDGLAYVIVNTEGGLNDFVSGLYSYDLVTNTQNLIKFPLVEDASQSQFINGIGFNSLDNNIYGMQQFTNNIVKIDASGNVEYLPITGSFVAGNYSAGDIDENGILYLHGVNKFISIDLNPTSPNYLTSTDLLTYSTAIHDVTFSPVDGNLYMLTSTATKKLLRFNVADNTIDDLGAVTGLDSESDDAFGTAFTDALGNMYVANNESGNIYKIDTPHTGNINATYYSNLVDVNPGDGARCPAQIIPPIAQDDYACLTADVTEIDINALENDSEGTYDIDITSVQLIDPITSLPTNTVTIPGEGTFTVGANGTVLFEALPGFTGTSVEYTIADSIGTPSMPAIITVSANTTSAPTGSDVQEFCSSSDPTVADLTATGEDIQWYESENSTSPIDASEALIDGDVYYATQTTSDACESQERLEVTVNFTADITLVTTEELECSEDGTTYTIIATFTGSGPFTADGSGQPGTWEANDDDTFTWTSDAIPGDQDYNVEILDNNACNTITLSGEAAICCEFEVTCPTFDETTVACYGDLPTETSYSIQEFEALGNADGVIGDNACGLIEITAQNSSDQGTCEQNITRTYTITSYEDTNSNGVRDEDETTILNSAECTQLILVSDNIAPTFTVPEDITIECDVDVTDLSITGEVTDAADNCSTELEATFTDSAEDGTCPGTSTISRVWTLTDSCDNSTILTQTITVQDTTAPTFNETLPADVDAECDAVPTAETLTASDSCGSADVVFEEEITNGSCTGDYIIERTWIATDSCGNETMHTQIINVQDNTPPTAVSDFEENINVLCDAIPEVPSPVFEDSCSNDISVSFDEVTSEPNENGDYTITRTWTVTDDCENQALYTQNVNVEMTNVIYANDANRCILDIEFDLFDLLSGDFNTNGTWSVVSGDASIDGSLFDPTAADVGEYTFMYAITEGACPTDVEVNVTLDDDCVVLACGEDDVVISKTVTANGDAHNEFFTITGVEGCGFVVELQIFNRWGAEIYKSNNYLNDWNGEAHSSSIGNSGKVPTGTYYYIINLKNSGLAPIAGPIYVATN